ncbi:hypothetical protein ZHAS_00002789 [Anopheles sinensis]|uniref:Uncharacterized protein n=1 Tax=Anopheles sinensis TaxID=74873 RepID=A0A084WV18_ANOSI|nr:hypothetical protein ZHAS_00002789 [Anopheles sinensis]
MSDNRCGISCWHPGWLQRFATPKSFILVYGFLGTVQAMAYIYFVITLTTLEKRFKIPSSTTVQVRHRSQFDYTIWAYLRFVRQTCLDLDWRYTLPNPSVLDFRSRASPSVTRVICICD